MLCGSVYMSLYLFHVQTVQFVHQINSDAPVDSASQQATVVIFGVVVQTKVMKLAAVSYFKLKFYLHSLLARYASCESKIDVVHVAYYGGKISNSCLITNTHCINCFSNTNNYMHSSDSCCSVWG